MVGRILIESVNTPLHVRWLGRVAYEEALILQQTIARSDASYLLLLEHPHCFSTGVRTKREHLLVEPDSVGATLHEAHRGGDITYHGPGQLVGYPIVSIGDRTGLSANAQYVHVIEQLLIDVLHTLGIAGASRKRGFPGVWIGDQKVAAVGVAISRGRTMHGFSLNINPDLAWFEKIVPCGIREFGVTSLRALGFAVEMRDVIATINRLLPASEFAEMAAIDAIAYASVAWERDLVAGGIDISEAKPEWMRASADISKTFLDLRARVKQKSLTTVCQEAGCPNIFECWNEGTATFMINGDRCTRACKFCLVDTRKPLPLDPGEPERVADAVAEMNLRHAVITVVARDDLPDGGANAVAQTIAAIRRKHTHTAVETLISDCKGDAHSLRVIFDERPDVLNHNLECVARLQRLVRPSAGYARSLGVLSLAKEVGLTTKSGMMVGLGETYDEVVEAMHDLRAVGVSILTIGQYLRPSSEHLPVQKWWTPDEFAQLREAALVMGFAHVEASPLTRSSYRASHAVPTA